MSSSDDERTLANQRKERFYRRWPKRVMVPLTDEMSDQLDDLAPPRGRTKYLQAAVLAAAKSTRVHKAILKEIDNVQPD